MSEELKPCPFCGSVKANVYHDHSSDHRYDWTCHVECDACNCSGESDKSEAEAIAAWNRRATPPAMPSPPSGASADNSEVP